MTGTNQILKEVRAEREHQEALRMAGRFKHTASSDGIGNAEKSLILGEEVGEVCRAAMDLEHLAFDGNTGPASEFAAKLRTELIQVAAVAVAWAESL